MSIGAAALALGALAWWLDSDAEREPEWEVFRSAPLESRDLEGDATTRTTPVPVANERRAAETFGSTDAPATHKTFRLDVVDAGGRPASGVPIACGTVSPSAPEVFDARLRARTDADGSAWFELTDDALLFRAEILADPRPELAVDPGAEHAVLRLPPTGAVQLEVVDALGRAMPTAVRFGVWARAASTARNLEPLPRWIEASGGVALLEHVGLDLELSVAAAPEGDEARPERVVASGPRFDGEERTIAVSLGAEWPTVLVRALDEQGNVLCDESLEALVEWTRLPGAKRLWTSDGDRPRRVRTDDEGRVRLPLRGTVVGGSTRRLVLTHGDVGASGVLRSAERDLSWDVPSGELDLGDVVLHPQERSDPVVWVAGTVTDPAGNPVRSATVLASAIDAEGKLLPRTTAQVTVEADGRFVVTGPPLEQRVSVRAIARGFLGTAEIVGLGASDLRIHMEPAARWEGRLLLDADIPSESLVVEVITPERRLRVIPVSGRVAVTELAHERVDVEVRLRAGDWLVERRELVPTIPPGTPAGERIDELDLRGRLTHLHLRLVETDGTALDRVFAHVEPEPWSEGGAWIRAGRLDLVVPRDARTITIRPRGYPPIAAQLLDGVQELTCGPRIVDGA